MFKMVELANNEVKVYLLLAFLPIILCAEILKNAESNESKVPAQVGYETNSRPPPMTVVSRKRRNTRRLEHVTRPQSLRRTSAYRPKYFRRRLRRRRKFRSKGKNYPKHRSGTRRPLRRKMRRRLMRRRKYKGLRKSQSIHRSRTRKPGQRAILRNPVPRGSQLPKRIGSLSTNKLPNSRQTSTNNPAYKQSSSTVGDKQSISKAGKDKKKPKKGTPFPSLFRGIFQSIRKLKVLQKKFKKKNITRISTLKPSVVGPKQPIFSSKLGPSKSISVPNRKRPVYTNLKKPRIMTLFSKKKPHPGTRPRVQKRPMTPSRSRDISTGEIRSRVDKDQRFSLRKSVIIPTQRTARKESKVPTQVGYETNSRPPPMTVVSGQMRNTRRLEHVTRPQSLRRTSAYRPKYFRRRLRRRRKFRGKGKNYPKHRSGTRRPLRRKMRRRLMRRRKYKGLRKSQSIHRSRTRKPGQTAILRNPVPRGSQLPKRIGSLSTNKLPNSRQTSTNNPAYKQSSSTVGDKQSISKAGKDKKKPKKGIPFPSLFRGIFQSIRKLKVLQKKFKKKNITRISTLKPSVVGPKQPIFSSKLGPSKSISVPNRKRPGKVPAQVGYETNSRPSPMTVVSRQMQNTRRLEHVTRPQSLRRTSAYRPKYFRRRLRRRRKFRGKGKNYPKHRSGTRRPLRRKMRRRLMRRRKYKGLRKSQSIHRSRTRKPGQTAILRNPVPRGSQLPKRIGSLSTNKLPNSRQTSTNNPAYKQSSSTVGDKQSISKAGKDKKKPKKGIPFPSLFRGIFQSIRKLKVLQQKFKKMNITRISTLKPSVVGPKQPIFSSKLGPSKSISVPNRKRPVYTNLKKPRIRALFSKKKPHPGTRPRVQKRPMTPSRSRDISTGEIRSRVDKDQRFSPRKSVIIPIQRTARKKILVEKQSDLRSSVAPQRSHCRKPPHILHGHIRTPSSYSHGSKVIYSCKKGYKLVGIATHLCKSDGKWSGKTPTCVNDEKPGNKTDLKGQLTKITKDINDIEETFNGKAFIAGVIALVLVLLFLTCHCVRVSATRRALSDKHEEVVKEGLVPERDVPGVLEVSNGLCKKLCCCDSGLPTSFRPRKSRSRTSSTSLRNRQDNRTNSSSRTSERRSKRRSLHKVGDVSSRTGTGSKPSYDSIKENQINSSSRPRVRRSKVGSLQKVGGVSLRTSTSLKPSYDRTHENECLIDEEAIQAEYFHDSPEALPRNYEEEILPQYIDRRMSQSEKGADRPRYYDEEGVPQYIDRRISHSLKGADMLRYHGEEMLTQDIDRKTSQGLQEEPSDGIEAMPRYYDDDLPQYTARQIMYQSQRDSDIKDINDNSFIRYFNDNAALYRKIKHNQKKLGPPKYTKNERDTSTSPYFRDRKRVKLADSRKTRGKRRSGIRLSPISRRCESKFVSGTRVVLPDIRQENKVKNQTSPSRYTYRNRNTNTNIDTSEEISKLPLYNARQSLLTYRDYQEYIRDHDCLVTDEAHKGRKKLTSTTYSDVNDELYTMAREKNYLDELDLLRGPDFGDHIELSKIYHGEQKQDVNVRNIHCVNDFDIQGGLAHGILKAEINLDSGTELQNRQQAVNGNEYPEPNEIVPKISSSGFHYEEEQSSSEHVQDDVKNQNEAVDQSEQADNTENIKVENCSEKEKDVSLGEPNYDNTLTNSVMFCDHDLFAVQSEGNVRNRTIEADETDGETGKICRTGVYN